MKMRCHENDKKDVAGIPGSVTDIKQVMQRIFTTSDGQRLLRYLLYDWNFFSICTTADEQAMRNYAAKFLNELGNVFEITVSAEIVIAGK
jgi:phage baseplate assembly protein W